MAETTTEAPKKRRGRPPKAKPTVTAETLRDAGEKIGRELATSSPARRLPIPVRQLVFPEGNAVRLPGNSRVTTSCKRRTDERQGFEIEFYPWLQSFKVTFFEHNGNSVMAMVPLAKVDSWMPVSNGEMR